MSFRILIEPEAIRDIQEAVYWYNDQQSNLGKKFHNTIEVTLSKLKKNPFFQIRYDDVHCLPVKVFPYMIHFTVDEERKVIIVRAVFHTSQTPDKWK